MTTATVDPAPAPAAPAPTDPPTPAPTAPAATPEPAAAPAPAPEKPAEKKSVLKPAADEKKKDGKADPPAKDGQPKGKEGTPDAPYEVVVPEGVTVDKAKLGEFTGWAKEKGLSAQQASEALGFYSEQRKAEAVAWAAQGDGWYDALSKDPEFGGTHLQESSVALQKALKKFDPQGALAKDLEKYGVENLPSIAKFLRRVGLAAAEDKVSVETSKGEGAKKVTSEAERLAKRLPSLAKALTGNTHS